MTFNYDRSLEQFLRDAFSHAFGCSLEEAETELNHITITHVHGQLGELPAVPGGPGRAYAPRVTEESLRIGAEGIVVIPEADEIHEGATRLVRGAKQVVFLGFAYHESNMRRLGIEDRDLQTSHFNISPRYNTEEVTKCVDREGPTSGETSGGALPVPAPGARCTPPG